MCIHIYPRLYHILYIPFMHICHRVHARVLLSLLGCEHLAQTTSKCCTRFPAPRSAVISVIMAMEGWGRAAKRINRICILCTFFFSCMTYASQSQVVGTFAKSLKFQRFQMTQHVFVVLRVRCVTHVTRVFCGLSCRWCLEILISTCR